MLLSDIKNLIKECDIKNMLNCVYLEPPDLSIKFKHGFFKWDEIIFPGVKTINFEIVYHSLFPENDGTFDIITKKQGITLKDFIETIYKQRGVSSSTHLLTILLDVIEYDKDKKYLSLKVMYVIN